MSLFLSLQGSMAAGKTTVARYLEACLPEIHVSYEENRSVIEEIRRRGLNKNKYEDYLEIQKLWLKVGSLQRLSLYRHGFWGRGDCVLHAELSPFHGVGLGGGDSFTKGAGTGKRLPAP